MLRKKNILGLLLLGVLLSNQSFAREDEDPARVRALGILQPYLQAIKNSDSRLKIPSVDLDQVKVFLVNNQTTTLPAPREDFPNKGTLAADQIDSLKNYITSNRAVLGAEGTTRFGLQFVVQNNDGNAVYVRFRQVVAREILNQPYVIPIEGAQIIANIENGRLKTLNSQLVQPPSLVNALNSPGFRLLFSDNEMAHFMGLIKMNDTSSALVQLFLSQITGILNAQFTYSSFLNRQLSEQRQIFERAFSSMGSIALRRFIISSAQKNRIAFVRYGSEWRIQVSELFELPIQFDVSLPQEPGKFLEVTNLRHISHKISPVFAFESPFYPGGKKNTNTDHTQRAIAQMTTIMDFFYRHFGWSSYDGKDSDTPVEIFTQLKSLDFLGNAAWLSTRKQFVIGEDSDSLHNLVDSRSVMGHEYTHAIVQFSSGLVYRGESGAINEHFADLQGASIQAEHDNNFKFTVGSEILRPQVVEEKKKLLDLIFLKTKYTDEEIREFSLDHIGLRHLFAPVLSYATQYDNLNDARKAYGLDCQPSVDNDNCGVHTVSGVANKAAALIIAAIGFEETQSLFFNTVVYRLSSTASLEDYVVHLHEECLSNPTLVNQCDLILASFAAVGVRHPQLLKTITPPATPLPNKENPADQKATSSMSYAKSPELKFCGWVDLRQNDDVRIYDDKYNATMITRNNVVRTQGDFIKIKGWHCACATGQVTQTVDRNGSVFNAFTSVSSIEDRGVACAHDKKIRLKKPAKEPIDLNFKTRSHMFCGWVSVSSASRNITIIDNRYDAAILVNGYKNLTKGDFTDVYKNQCSCVSGKLAETTNSKGTVFNYFSSIEPNGIQIRPKEACFGIQWR